MSKPDDVPEWALTIGERIAGDVPKTIGRYGRKFLGRVIARALVAAERRGIEIAAAIRQLGASE